MLNFKKTNIVFIILALLLGALATRYHIAWYLCVDAVAVFAGAFLWVLLCGQ